MFRIETNFVGFLHDNSSINVLSCMLDKIVFNCFVLMLKFLQFVQFCLHFTHSLIKALCLQVNPRVVLFVPGMNFSWILPALLDESMLKNEALGYGRVFFYHSSTCSYNK